MQRNRLFQLGGGHRPVLERSEQVELHAASIAADG
jgi:hypothetical protein